MLKLGLFVISCTPVHTKPKVFKKPGQNVASNGVLFTSIKIIRNGPPSLFLGFVEN